MMPILFMNDVVFFATSLGCFRKAKQKKMYRYRNFGSVISLILPAPWGRLADIHVLLDHVYPFSQAKGSDASFLS